MFLTLISANPSYDRAVNIALCYWLQDKMIEFSKTSSNKQIESVRPLVMKIYDYIEEQWVS